MTTTIVAVTFSFKNVLLLIEVIIFLHLICQTEKLPIKMILLSLKSNWHDSEWIIPVEGMLFENLIDLKNRIIREVVTE